MSKLYLKSTAEGKTWSVGFAKQPKQPAYWFAIEGELEHSEFGDCFKFMVFEARSRRQRIDGAATAKKKEAALETLINSMKAEGLTH